MCACSRQCTLVHRTCSQVWHCQKKSTMTGLTDIYGNVKNQFAYWSAYRNNNNRSELTRRFEPHCTKLTPLGRLLPLTVCTRSKTHACRGKSRIALTSHKLQIVHSRNFSLKPWNLSSHWFLFAFCSSRNGRKASFFELIALETKRFFCWSFLSERPRSVTRYPIYGRATQVLHWDAWFTWSPQTNWWEPEDRTPEVALAKRPPVWRALRSGKPHLSVYDIIMQLADTAKRDGC